MRTKSNKRQNVLGIDYGRKKVGVAFADGLLAEPVIVYKFKDQVDLIKKIKSLVEEKRVKKIVIGISEGLMAQVTKNFVSEIQKQILIPIDYFDETLSSFDAKQFSIQAGHSKKKRREKEDAYAAAIMLQNYLDKMR